MCGMQAHFVLLILWTDPPPIIPSAGAVRQELISNGVVFVKSRTPTGTPRTVPISDKL